MGRLFNHRKRVHKGDLDLSEWESFGERLQDEETAEEAVSDAPVYFAEEWEYAGGMEDNNYEAEYEEDQYTEEYADDAGYAEDAGEDYGMEYEDEPRYADGYEEDADYGEAGEDDYAEEYEEPAYYAEDEENNGAYAQEEYYGEEDAGDSDREFYIEDMPETYETGSRRRKKGLAAVWNGFVHMGFADKLVTCTGVIILIVAMVAGTMYAGMRFADARMSELVSVGASLKDIELPGQEGLLAVADAEASRKAAAEAMEEERRRQEEEAARQEQPEYNENEYYNSVKVKLTLSSIEKDLKIKFTNKDSGKLISNVPFKVKVTDSSGNVVEWTDDDLDGIIYKTGLTPGMVSVRVQTLESNKYKNYELPDSAQRIEVKAEIVYEQVDVTGEVKNESDIDVSKEESGKNHNTQQEETLGNTVDWVESTQTPAGYKEVDKNLIADPLTLVYAGNFQRLAQENTENSGILAASENAALLTVAVNPSELSLGAGESFQLQAVLNNGTLDAGTVSWSSDRTDIVTVDAGGKITAVAAGTATITCTYIPSASVSGGNETVSYTGTCAITVLGRKEIQLDQTAVTAYTGIPVTVNATVLNAVDSAAVAAESSDTGIAVVTVDGSRVIITGVSAGSAVITVRFEQNGITAEASCAVTVKTDPKTDQVSRLKDTFGNQVFVQENGVYREAAYADYYTAEKFYIQSEVKYTGWQTINGKVYYFDADGDPVTGEQVIEGARYNFAADGTLITDNVTRGIDVSKWNGKIDWGSVKNSGIDFVIIRCGYRGYSNGALVEDVNFKTNIQGAINAGLKVGVYFFTQAVSASEAVEEASMVLEQVKNYSLSYPIFLDVEASGSATGNGRADKLSVETRTEVCRAFCETIQSAGYTAGIYANKTWLTSKIDTSSLNAYKIWLAQYAATPTYTGKYDMWQYQATGRISGISTDVDMNWSYMGY